MNYYVLERETKESLMHTAGVKARDDINAILDDLQFQPLKVEVSTLRQKGAYLKKIKNQFDVYKSWKQACSSLKKGDVMFVQFPVMAKTVLLRFLCHQLQRRGVSVVLLLHDVESYRSGMWKNASWLHQMNIRLTESGVIRLSKIVIVHNDNMKKVLISQGIPENQIVSLGVFDYLIPDFDISRRSGKTRRDLPILIAGNLRKYKAGYAYNLPSNCEFNLYGVDYTGEKRDNIHYFGAFPSDELPEVLEGSFGLVWDGESEETCSGIYGEYMKINNPHKMSLYLACGIPVAVWSQAAVAQFVLKNKVGIVVNALHELQEVVSKMTDAEYDEMAGNAKIIGEKLRNAQYTKEAIRACGIMLPEGETERRSAT